MTELLFQALLHMNAERDGLLCGIRICDYAGYEQTIDWNQLDITKDEAQRINYVDTFPSGCGCKNQEELI